MQACNESPCPGTLDAWLVAQYCVDVKELKTKESLRAKAVELFINNLFWVITALVVVVVLHSLVLCCLRGYYRRRLSEYQAKDSGEGKPGENRTGAGRLHRRHKRNRSKKIVMMEAMGTTRQTRTSVYATGPPSFAPRLAGIIGRSAIKSRNGTMPPNVKAVIASFSPAVWLKIPNAPVVFRVPTTICTISRTAPVNAMGMNCTPLYLRRNVRYCVVFRSSNFVVFFVQRSSRVVVMLRSSTLDELPARVHAELSTDDPAF